MSVKSTFNAELFFSALADRTRLRLLNLMRDGEVCVCFFAETLATNNPKISRHLSYLKRASLVNARRQGKWMHYSINPPSEGAPKEVFDATLKLLETDPEMQNDRKNLVSVCCNTSAMVKIERRDVVSS